MIVMDADKVGWVPVPLLIATEPRKPTESRRTAVTYFFRGFCGWRRVAHLGRFGQTHPASRSIHFHAAGL